MDFEKEILNRLKNTVSVDRKYSVEEKIAQYEKMFVLTDELCKDVIDYKRLSNKTEGNCKDKDFEKYYYSQIEKTENSQNSKSLDIKKSEYQVIKEQRAAFEKEYAKMKKFHSIAVNGIKGENATFNALKMLDYKIRILQNVNTYLDTEVVEHDVLIISESGIFTIEIKYVSTDVEITEQGMLKRKNIIEQTRKHIHSLKRLLIDTKYSEIPVYSIIVFSNDSCNVVSKNKNITVCYRNDIENIIFDENKYPLCLTKEDCIEIEEIISEKGKNIKAIKYPLDIDENVYYEKLAKYVDSELNLQKKLCERREEKKQERKKKKEQEQTAKKIETAIDVGRFILGAIDNLF